ncbi:uncharacterized protein LOC142344930 [Convolutriloba macropyga]|uniref:uncharacterized protein LOC142344930 n=1 Tax=Convolutriloba macropyga TaxID=536237 RepID=UPI003F51DE75
MSSEIRQSSRRTSKRPKVLGSENVPTASLIPFPSGRKSFFCELVKFHSERGTPLPRFPTIAGQFIDLFELYCAVINRGGFNRSTTYDSWSGIAETLGFQACSNLTVALRQIYARYLAHYESLTISLDDEDFHDFDDMHGDAGSVTRRKTIPTMTVCNIPVQMTYNFDSNSKQSRSSSRSHSMSSCGNYLDKMFMSLVSGLPNELSFVLDTCMLMSFDPNHAFAMCEHEYMLSVILANVGILPNSSTFAALYSQWYSTVNLETDFTKFWLTSVKDSAVQKFMMGLELFQDVISNCPSTLSGFSCSTISHCNANESEHRRISVILYLIRHLSFEVKNQPKLALNEAVQQFLLFCIGNKYANLKVLALDTVANLASSLNLSNECLFNVTVDILLGLLNSPDSVDRIRCMEVIAGLCQNPATVASFIVKMEMTVFEKIVAMLTVQDLLVLLSCVGLLYQLSYLGTDMCDTLVKVKYLIDLLTALVTFDVQSMGYEALTSVKVIEQPKSMLAKVQSSATGQSEQQGLELERLAVKWLLTSYEFSSEENIGVISNDILPLFRKYCMMANFRTNQELSLVQFNRCLRMAFPSSPHPKLVSSSEGSMYFSGIRKKSRSKVPIPPNGMNAFPQLKHPGSTKNSYVDHMSIQTGNKQPGVAKTRPGMQQPLRPVPSIGAPPSNEPLKPKPKQPIPVALPNIKVESNVSTIAPVCNTTCDANQGSNQTTVIANHVAIPKQLCEAPCTKPITAMQAQSHQTQQPILVQVMMPGSSNESAFKKQTSAKTALLSASNGPITVVNEHNSSSSAPAKQNTPTFVLNSVSNNQVYLSPIGSKSSVNQSNQPQASLMKAAMKPVISTDTSNLANSNSIAISQPNAPLVISSSDHLKTVSNVVYHSNVGNNNNNASSPAPTPVIGKPLTVAQQNAPIVVATNTHNPTSHSSKATINQTAVSIPGFIVKPIQVAHSSAMNQQPIKIVESSSQSKPVAATAVMNGNYAAKMNGEVNPSEINLNAASLVHGNSLGISVNGGGGLAISQSQQRNSSASPSIVNFGPLVKSGVSNGSNVVSNNSAQNTQIAYQNQNGVVSNCKPSSLVSGNGNAPKCEVNGVVYKLVNESPLSVTNEVQQKIVYVAPQNGNEGSNSRVISQPHIILNGDAGDHISEIKNIVAANFASDSSGKVQVIGQAVNCVPSIGAINGGTNQSRKRRNSGEVQNQVLITTGNNGDEPSLSVFRKVKINEVSNTITSNTAANLVVQPMSNSATVAANAAGNQVAKKEPTPSSSSFSGLPSLHAAVNSVIAASADGTLIGSSNNQVSVTSSSGSGVAKIVVQPSNAQFSTSSSQNPKGTMSQSGPQKRQNLSISSTSNLQSQKPNSQVDAQDSRVPQKSTSINGFHGKESGTTFSRSDPNQSSQDVPGSSGSNPNEDPVPPKEPRLEASTSSDQNPNAVFRCEWYNCSSRFEKWQEVFHHCCRVHCSDVGSEGAICQWNACDGLRRKRLSLFTHLHEKHCTEGLLKSAISKNPNREPCRQPTVASAHAESLYNTHTLHHALQRSGWVPPNKDQTLSVFEKEGPVSKAVRLNAALVLRNLAQHSTQARELIKLQERKLSLAAASCIEAAPFLANCLLNLCNLETN